MTLTNNLSEFRFNLETIDLLTSMGRTMQQTFDEMKVVGFTSQQVQFILSSRSLLNSVLLRLHLYSEQNLKEATIRSNLSVLNNTIINSLLDKFFYNSQQSSVIQPVVNYITKTPSAQSVDNVTENDDEDDTTVVVESSRFDQFFKACVKQTNDTTDIVKTSDFYNAFTEWWGGIYEESVPDKNELKDFITIKLGKPNKNTWSNVSMV